MIDDRDELARFRLDGRVAIVTGGTGGIGSRLCQALARVGAYVVVHGRDRQRAEALARRLSNEGGVASAAIGDMTRRADADRVVETALANYGRVDAIVTTVGGGGRVLHFSSVRGQLGIDNGFSAYVAAKGALNALTRQQATEWAKHGITVNAISPTFVATPQVADLLADEEFRAGLEQRIPLGRIADTDDLVG